MRIAICDDEKDCIDDLFQHLEKYKEEHKDILIEIDSYTNSNEFISEFMKEGYDLVYLDIELNDANGMNVARMIKKMKPSCMVIFVTNHMDYFNQSFIVNAFQYLKKPVKRDFLYSELERAIKQFQFESRSFTFSTTSGNQVFGAPDIIYLETSYREYKVYSIRGQYYGSVKSINEIRTTLEEYNFCKIQRSFLVNLAHIIEYNHDTITMQNGDVLPISKKRYKEFRTIFFRFLNS